MLDILIEKFKNNKISSNLNFKDYSFEYTPTGLLLIRKNRSVIFFRNDGKVYKISTRFNTIDWDMYCRLYEKILKYNDCRIEIPLYQETITINNVPLTYTEVQRPGFEFGTVVMNDYVNKKINSDYFLEYIDLAAIALGHLTDLNSKFNTGVPEGIFTIYTRNRDNDGYFWTDIRDWNVSIEVCKQRKIYALYYILNSFQDSILDKNFIMNYAVKQWKIKYE